MILSALVELTNSMSKEEQTSLVLNPEQLALYLEIDPALPAIIVQARNQEIQRRFIYAMASLGAGVIVVLAIFSSFIYPVMNGHTEAASALLGVSVLGLVGGFVRSRL